MSALAWFTIAIFVGVYVLIATERVHRVAAALGGAAVVLVLGIVDSEQAFYSQETGIDWNVIFLLLGMMLVVGVLRRTGVFEYVAIRSAKLAGGKPYGVLVMLVLVTAVASALLDNVTTVLLVAPVTLLVCDRLGLAPVPVPDRRGAGLQHRRRGDPGRRPAQHHHRQPGRPDVQRLPGPHAAGRGDRPGGLRRDGPLAVPQRPAR